MKTSHFALFLSIFLFTPLMVLGQITWKSSVDHINEKRAFITGIIYEHGSNQQEEYLDSLHIVKDLEFDKVVLELYTTMAAIDDPVDYVIATDLPLTHLVDVSSNNGQLKLSFSRDCKKNGVASDHLYLNIDSVKERYVMQAAFKHLKYTGDSYKKLKHDATVCSFGNQN